MKLPQTATRCVGTALAVAGVAFSALPNAIAEHQGPEHKNKFLSLDANHDGFISKNEVAKTKGYDKAFDEADENRDGRLSPDEFLKAESNYQRQKAAAYLDDSVITAKVKAALLKAPELKSLDVSVETYKGQVLLSGFVTDAKQRERALKVASGVEGVANVKDGLVIR